MMKIATFILLYIIVISCKTEVKTNTIFQLKVAENNRYLETSNKEPFFWLADTGWLLFSKTTREDAAKYLSNREENGFNVVQVMLIHSVGESVNVYGDSALIKQNIATPNVTEGNSFEKPEEYDYWDHIDYIIDLAAEHGIYMALVPVWGGNVKSGKVSNTAAKIYAEFLAKRYANKANIIWLNGGDIKGNDSTEVWKTIGNTIKKIDTNHLMTFHPYGRHSSSYWFHNEPWIDFNMFQSGHRNYFQDTVAGEHHFGPDNWKYVNHDLLLSPAKPTLDGEPSYEEIPWGLHDTLQTYWNENDVRRYAYWSVFAGACGFTYGHNAVMQFFCPGDNKAYGAKTYWYNAIDAPGACQMKYLKQLILSHSYFDRIPDQSIIFGMPKNKLDYAVATRGTNYLMVYCYNGKIFSLNMGKISGTVLNVSWFNPRNGETIQSGTVENKGIVEFNAPGQPENGNDWVLILE